MPTNNTKYTNLASTQKWMQAALITPKKKEIDAYVNEYIAPAKVLSPMQSLAIYQRSYYSRLIECMHGQFKALVYTLGNELFEDFCKMYLTKHPSNSASLANLGNRFPAFLEEQRPDKEAPELWIDFMIAMAKFEVDLYKIFDIKGSEGEIFASTNTTDEALKLQKCIDFQEYPFDVNTYYKKVSENENPEITAAYKTYIAFVRTDYQVYVLPLNKIQYELLKMIQKETNVKTALFKIIALFDLDVNQFFLDWNLWRKKWIEKGFFLKV